MEKLLKPFFDCPRWFPFMVSPHAHKRTRFCGGIVARMWQSRQHLELSPVCLELQVRDTSTGIPIHQLFLHCLICNSELQLHLLLTDANICSLSLLILRCNSGRNIQVRCMKQKPDRRLNVTYRSNKIKQE